MAQLTCGTDGSTGLEIVTQINTNTDTLAAHESRLDSIEQDIVWLVKPDPKSTLKLEAERIQTITDDADPIVLEIADTALVQKGGFKADPVTHSLSNDSGRNYPITKMSISLNVSFPGSEELELYLYQNGSAASTAPFAIQGRGSGKPVAFTWMADFSFYDGDTIDIRARNADSGSFDLTILACQFRVESDYEV
jgi:hypothetical protein